MSAEIEKAFVVQVLNTSTGDLLKALIINKFTDLKIELSKLPLPQGVASSYFGRKPLAPIPPTEPVRKDTGNQTRISSTPVIAHPKYEDIDVPESEIKAPTVVATPQQSSDKEWLSVAEAAEFTGLTVNSVRTYVTTKGWEKRQKSDGRGIEIKRTSLLPFVKQEAA